MKKNPFLGLALFAVLVSSAAAQAQSEPLALPTYVVETERSVDAERLISRSLAALRAQAGKPVTVSVELPALKAHLAQVAREIPATRLAKS